MDRRAGERVRLKHAIARARATIDSMERVLDDLEHCYPLGVDMGVPLLETALEIVRYAAAHDAYALADAERARGFKPVCAACNDTHRVHVEDHGDRWCTQCPTPCAECRQGAKRRGGLGSYCEVTPCPCECHRKGGA